VTEVVEKLAEAAERHVEAKLTRGALAAYRDDDEDDRPDTV
jgi:hypothetical protein